MNYFKETQYIAQVDKDDNIIGKVEKWNAHKQGILHRAFTIAIFYEDQVLLQHRKHPVFDSVYDITISSHQLYTDKELQSDEEAIMNTLKREWHITEGELIDGLHMKGSIYYKAHDPFSEYTEHEICHIYSCSVSEIKMPNLEFAYGFSLQNVLKIKEKNNPIFPLLAPWVKKAFEDNLL